MGSIPTASIKNLKKPQKGVDREFSFKYIWGSFVSLRERPLSEQVVGISQLNGGKATEEMKKTRIDWEGVKRGG